LFSYHLYLSAKERISEVPGLSDRLRLFMLPEYRLQGADPKNEQVEKYSGSKYEPIFTILSKEAAPRTPGNAELVFGFGTLLVTLVTCFMYATDVNSLNPGFLEKALTAASGSVDGAAVSVEALLAGREVVGRLLPIAFGLIGLQAVHDLGHNIAAKNHDTKLSLPYLLPSLQIGIFGTITNFLTFPKTRKAIFDISIAGPALGFVFSLACAVYGLALTAGATAESLATFPALPAAFLDSSFLLHELADQFLHTSTAAAATPALTAVHPLVAIGMTGLLTNAFNFLPIGRLDGGRVAMAVGGRQSADNIAFITLIGQAIMFLTNASPISFFWILVVVFLQRGTDIPPEDDVSPIATEEEDAKKSPGWIARALTLAFCAGLTGATILPVPQPYDQTQQTIQAPAPSPSQAPGASNILQGLEGLGKMKPVDT
jgi:Zn-dependent protease